MLISIHPDAQAVAARAADLVETLLSAKPDAVIGLAAGATPLAMYGELVRRRLDFSRATLFGLDEYLGLGNGHPASCAFTLRHHFIERVNIDPARVHLLDGLRTDGFGPYCADYEEAIGAAGGLDIQVLGIGVNGHVGFNEPGCSLAGRTHVAVLRASTRATNHPIFAPAETPPTAVTMGIATILAARRVLLLATGESKAAAVARAAEGPLSASIPASALQMHPDAVMMLDEAAAGRLEKRADYLEEARLLANLSP